jgi:hypothetical protein
MSAINEDLIMNVFAGMVKNKPSLTKYIPEKDEDEEIDYRIIGDLIIINFPCPVGAELRRLFSGSMGRFCLLIRTLDSTCKEQKPGWFSPEIEEHYFDE